MRLLLVDDDGTILDNSDEFTREEWSRLNMAGAGALVASLSAGPTP